MTFEQWIALAAILIPLALALASGVFGLVGWVLWKLIERLMAKSDNELAELKKEVKSLGNQLNMLRGFLKRSGHLPSSFDRESPPLHIETDQ